MRLGGYGPRLWSHGDRVGHGGGVHGDGGNGCRLVSTVFRSGRVRSRWTCITHSQRIQNEGMQCRAVVVTTLVEVRGTLVLQSCGRNRWESDDEGVE